MWILTIFMFISAIVFIPSEASIIMLVFAAISIPLNPVQEFWASRGLNRLLKVVLLCVLFGVCVWLAPV